MKLNGIGGSFEVAPEGLTQAVLVDIVDMGMQTDRFNEGELIHKMRLVFQTEEQTTAGTPFQVSTYPYTASFSPKSNVRKFVEQMLGKKLERADFDEGGEFDLDGLIGTNAMITITHTAKTDKVYANITNVTPLSKSNKTRLEPVDYIRVQDREEADGEQIAISGEKVPF